jgi:hypothetical protein
MPALQDNNVVIAQRLLSQESRAYKSLARLCQLS